jgi:hypothetical protein
MSDDTAPKPVDTGPWSNVVLWKNASGRRCEGSAHRVRTRVSRFLYAAGWHKRLAPLFLGAVAISSGSADTTTDRVLLPVEVVGTDGTTASKTVALQAGQAESVRSLWLQIHGLRYPDQASIQVNRSTWIPLNNDTVSIAEPGRSFGGIGGFATLAMTLSLPSGTVVDGTNTVRFRFNHSDGLASGYRVLAWNFLTNEGNKVLLRADFVEDAPETWTSPLPDAASIHAGQELWLTASLVASSLPDSPRIRARCADCHAHDGRDLKYFNFSNASIIARSRFHGLTTLQGEQIASYIRSLPLPNPGRPWNPPYQPGPGLDEQPISNWAAGAGLAWLLDQDTEALPYLLNEHGKGLGAAASHHAPAPRQLAGEITPNMFRPDGNLNPREIPIALQLPDWSQWLPRIHPKDAWGPAFAKSEFAAMYYGRTESKSGAKAKPSLRKLLTAPQAPDSNMRSAVPAFAHWSQARSAFLEHFVKRKTVWSAELSNKVYSTQLWQLMKTWEITQEFGLEGLGRDLFGAGAESRTWCNTIPADTAPSAAHIPNGPAGIGGSALTNEYLSGAWYELQIVLNSGSHQHRDRTPIDWVYLIGQFRDLYRQSHKPEPVRLLVAVTKALQSTDPHLGPDNYSQGWRPDQNIDPRILISPNWAPIFKPFALEVRRALAESLLAAWMDKTLQYPITEYLPLVSLQHDYTPRYRDRDISGGKVWEAAEQFRANGVSDDLVERLQNWGLVYTDRAARLQYH